MVNRGALCAGAQGGLGGEVVGAGAGDLVPASAGGMAAGDTVCAGSEDGLNWLCWLCALTGAGGVVAGLASIASSCTWGTSTACAVR